MEEVYCNNDTLSSKADEWISKLYLRDSRNERFDFNLKNSALIVVDMQSFFLNKKSHAFIPSAPYIIPNINSIISAFRKQNLPIIFTYHALEEKEDPGIMEKWWGDMLRVNDPLAFIDPAIDRKEDDIVLRKNRYSAFIGTNLDKILKEKNVDTVVIIGVVTHLCCESTARDAFMKDYTVYFVVDATATDTEDLHLSSLKTLSDGFILPVKTQKIVEEGK